MIDKILIQKRTAAAKRKLVAEANGGHVVDGMEEKRHDTVGDVNSVRARRLLMSQMLRLFSGQSTDALNA